MNAARASGPATLSNHQGGARLERLDWPPGRLALAAGDAVYVRPLRLSRLGDAEPDGGVLPLAGGPLAFAAVDLVIRRAGRFGIATASLADLRRWMASDGAAMAGTIGAHVARLSAQRPPFAGLALDVPVIMGIINVTPDSFSDGGQFFDPRSAIAQGFALAEAGARILDIGGESTRPGAAPVSEQEELDRVLPVIEGLRGAGAVLSIDTRHATVAKAALAAGARILNDVTALADPDSAAIARTAGAAVVLMHMQGEPRTMQNAPSYAFAPVDVFDALAGRAGTAEAAGLPGHGIAVDPGIGFGKSPAHNVEILAWLGLLHALGRPLVIGVSRKSFIAAISRGEPASRRLAGSLAAALAALDQGAQIIRVHDVAETVQAVTVWQRIRG